MLPEIIIRQFFLAPELVPKLRGIAIDPVLALADRVPNALPAAVRKRERETRFALSGSGSIASWCDSFGAGAGGRGGRDLLAPNRGCP